MKKILNNNKMLLLLVICSFVSSLDAAVARQKAKPGAGKLSASQSKFEDSKAKSKSNQFFCNKFENAQVNLYFQLLISMTYVIQKTKNGSHKITTPHYNVWKIKLCVNLTLGLLRSKPIAETFTSKLVLFIVR